MEEVGNRLGAEMAAIRGQDSHEVLGGQESLRDVGLGARSVGRMYAKDAIPGRMRLLGRVWRHERSIVASSSRVLLLCVPCFRRMGRNPVFLLMQIIEGGGRDSKHGGASGQGGDPNNNLTSQ